MSDLNLRQYSMLPPGPYLPDSESAIDARTKALMTGIVCIVVTRTPIGDTFGYLLDDSGCDGAHVRVLREDVAKRSLLNHETRSTYDTEWRHLGLAARDLFRFLR